MRTGGVLMKAEPRRRRNAIGTDRPHGWRAAAGAAPIERLVNKVSLVFVPTVLVAAVLTFVGWAIWGTESRPAHAC